MRHNSIVSFLKSIISFLAEFFPLWIFSEDETVLSTRLKRPDPAQYILPAMVSVFLGFSGQWNMAGAQGCDPSFRNCPGDIVVNVQPGTCGNNVSWTAPVMTAPCPGYTVTSNHEPGNFFNAGTTTVTYFSWEGTEKKDSCKFNVIVIDNQKPVVLTKNANLYIGQSGTAILRAADIDNGSYDNCSLILVPSRTVFTCSDVGQTIAVMLRGSDPSGNSSASGALVTVYDTVRPVIMTREFTLTLDNNGTGIIQASDIDNGTYDNCGPVTLSVTPSVFSCADQGDRTVRFTTTDIHGNTASRDVFISVRSSLKIHSISLSNCDAVGTYSLFNLNVSGGAGNYTYFWDCLDDNVKPFVQEIPYYPYVSFANTSHKVTPFFNNNIPNGSYTIRLTVTDGNGCRDSADMLIIKSGPVYGNVNFRKSVACEGSVVTYTVNPDPVATFDWEVENGTILSSVPYSNSVEVRWNLGVTRGVVRATLNKTNLVGEPCAATVIDSVSIDLIQPPVFNNPVNIACMGSEEIYTLTAPYQFYEWSVTGGVITEGGSDNNFVRVRWNEAPAGKVEVIVSTPAGCSSSAFVDVIINNLEGSVVSLTDISCNGAANGMVTVAAVEGSGLAPYEYSLDGGTYQSSGSFVNIGPGPHIVTIRDAHSCTFDVGFNITQPVILVASVNKSDVSCFGGSDGSVSVAGSGGTAPYEYSLNGGPFRTSGSFPGLPAGSYTVQVRDANLCTFVQKVMIMQPDAVSASAEVTIPVNCHGGTATVAITGSGGTPPLSYTFNGSVSTTGVFPGISAGVYEWSVTDANGCGPFRGTLEVTEPPQLSGSASVTGAIDCHGGTAIVTLTGSGGTSPLTYTFNGISNDTGIFTGIPAGNGYSWSITDANNCGPVSGVINVTEPPPINGAASVTTVIACHGGTATVRLTGGGGTAPLTYTFNGISNDTGIFTGIPAGSAYTWIITDSRGCGPVTGTLDVTEPAVITGSAMILVPVQCNGGTATVQLTGGGGTAPLTYTFNGISNETGIFTGISAGNGYIWSITDANNCSPVTGVTDISEPPVISTAASVATEITCHGGTATVTITGSGGTPPLSYTFNGSVSATGVFPGIRAGVYEWSVTDANGCGPFTGTLEVTEPPQLSGSASVTGAIDCYGGTATVTLTGSGGTSPLIYTFNGISNGTGIFTGIPAGNAYIWSITDANNCGPVNGVINVTEPPPINGAASVTTVIACHGGTATVTLTGSGGTSPLIYTFNGISNGTGIFTGIPAGSGYSWSITDARGCGPFTGTVDISEPEVINASVSITEPIICYGGTTTVILTGSGGTAPLTYTFNGISNDTGIFTGIPAADGYIWSITDANNCTPVTGTIDISEPPAISAAASVATEIACHGGTVTVTLTGSGGTSPLTYTFNGISNDTGIFTGIPAGNGYSWSITDANNCGPVSGVINVTEPPPINGAASVTTAIECHGGTATVRLTGGGGTAPLTYTFNGISNDTGIFTGIPAGSAYTWIITDSRGCGPVTGTLDVTEPAVITGSAMILVPVQCNSGTATVQLTGGGGTAPLTYTFNGISNETGIFTGISAGNGYIWSITDANNCSPVTGVTDISGPPAISAAASVATEIACHGGTVTVVITGSGGTPPLSYTFNGSVSATGVFPGISAGVYEWSVTDANGCGPFRGTLEVTEPPQLSGSASVTGAIACHGGTATVTLTGSGGTSPLTYTFNGISNDTGIFTGIPAGSGYSWSITDARGCDPITGTVDISEPEVINASVSITEPIICYGGTTTVIITGSGGTAPLTYTFNGISNRTGIFAGIPAGSDYHWSVTDTYLCTPAAGTLDITEPPEYRAEITFITNVSVSGGNDGSVTVEASGGTAPYLFRLNSGSYQPSGSFSDLTAGSYSVTVRDAALCETVLTVRITEPVVPLSGTLVSKEDILCFGASTGMITVSGTDGLAPYEYSLNGGDFRSSGIFTDLSAGSYIVTIRDAQPEEYHIMVILDEPATAVSVETRVINNICHGSNRGIAIAIADGGTGPYEFSWNSLPVQKNDTASGLAAGTYTVTVDDANGCRVTAFAVLTDPPPLTLGVITTDADCPDTYEGSAEVTVSGGNAPYNAFWEDGNTSFSRTEMLPGTYRLIVTDADGCVAQEDIVIGYSGTFGCLEIPQVITPNNDGFNDEWRIRNIEMYPDAEVLVYTRWGKLVYRSRNISADPWDGRFNGRLMPTDSYHYILYLNDGSRPRTGVISIIR